MPNARNVFLLTKQTSLFVYYIEFWHQQQQRQQPVWVFMLGLLFAYPLALHLSISFSLAHYEMVRCDDWLLLLYYSRFFLWIGQLLLLFTFFIPVIESYEHTFMYILSLYSMLRFLFISAHTHWVFHTNMHTLFIFYVHFFRVNLEKNRPTVAIAVRVMFVCSFIHISQSTIQRHWFIRSTENVCLCEEAMYTWHLFDMRMVKTMFECAWCRQWQWQRKVPFFHHTSMFIWRKAFCNI